MNRKYRTFMWREVRSWDGFVRGLMPRGVSEQVVRGIRQQQNLFKYYDDPDPLESIYSTFSDFGSCGKIHRNFRCQFQPRVYVSLLSSSSA